MRALAPMLLTSPPSPLLSRLNPISSAPSSSSSTPAPTSRKKKKPLGLSSSFPSSHLCSALLQAYPAFPPSRSFSPAVFGQPKRHQLRADRLSGQQTARASSSTSPSLIHHSPNSAFSWPSSSLYLPTLHCWTLCSKGAPPPPGNLDHVHLHFLLLLRL